MCTSFITAWITHTYECVVCDPVKGDHDVELVCMYHMYSCQLLSMILWTEYDCLQNIHCFCRKPVIDSSSGDVVHLMLLETDIEDRKNCKDFN